MLSSSDWVGGSGSRSCRGPVDATAGRARHLVGTSHRLADDARANCAADGWDRLVRRSPPRVRDRCGDEGHVGTPRPARRPSRTDACRVAGSSWAHVPGACAGAGRDRHRGASPDPVPRRVRSAGAVRCARIADGRSRHRGARAPSITRPPWLRPRDPGPSRRRRRGDPRCRARRARRARSLGTPAPPSGGLRGPPDRGPTAPLLTSTRDVCAEAYIASTQRYKGLTKANKTDCPHQSGCDVLRQRPAACGSGRARPGRAVASGPRAADAPRRLRRARRLRDRARRRPGCSAGGLAPGSARRRRAA